MIEIKDFSDLLSLPGTGAEETWIRERLSELSVKEGYLLRGAALRMAPKSGADVVNLLLNLRDYAVCYPAGSYEQLGRFYLEHETGISRDVLPFVDLERLGQRYEDEHPGVFVGDCFVTCPKDPPQRPYTENSLLCFEDSGWSVKLRLASAARPEGVWLRLPDYELANDGRADEIVLALDALGAKRVEECNLLEARCILPEAGDLMEQYDDLADLIYDGNSLGYVLDERGTPYFRNFFAAALEYEGCRTLSCALNISRNLGCYYWVPHEGLPEFARELLRGDGVPEELIQSGCFDLEGYAASQLENDGYFLTNNETGCIRRIEGPVLDESGGPEAPGPVLR